MPDSDLTIIIIIIIVIIIIRSHFFSSSDIAEAIIYSIPDRACSPSMSHAATVLEIIKRQDWLTEPHAELAAVSAAISRVWGPLHRALWVSAKCTYLAVQREREAQWIKQEGEEISRWYKFVVEYPANFDFD